MSDCFGLGLSAKVNLQTKQDLEVNSQDVEVNSQDVEVNSLKV
jgi:hypothetical protein